MRWQEEKKIKFLENCMSTEIQFETIAYWKYRNYQGKKSKDKKIRDPKKDRILLILSKIKEKLFR